MSQPRPAGQAGRSQRRAAGVSSAPRLAPLLLLMAGLFAGNSSPIGLRAAGLEAPEEMAGSSDAGRSGSIDSSGSPPPPDSDEASDRSFGPSVLSQATGLPKAFGLAHVDLMDLHIERRPDGGIVPRELLPAGDLADRYRKAADSGATWNRWSLYWDMVERSGGTYLWGEADAIVERDRASGLSTLAILQGTPGFHAGAADTGTVGSPAFALPGFAAGDRAPQALDFDHFGAHPWPRDAYGGGADPSGLDSAPPRGLDLPIFLDAGGRGTDDPAAARGINPSNPWARFVDAAVERYRPGGQLARERGWAQGQGVRAWEVGNEPNLTHFWSGTPAQFARYLEVAYLVIEWRDPQAIVVHGGIADASGAEAWYLQFLDALIARSRQTPLVARHGYYFDKAGWHWYVYPSLLVTGPARARGYLAAKGLPAKPIWVTEMGVPIWSEHPGPCWDPTSPWRATEVEQAGYIMQSFAEAIASAVENTIFFQLYDDCGNGPASYDAFGIVRNHASNQCWSPPAGEGRSCWRLDPAKAGRPRSGHAAFALMARELAGAELLWRPAREANFTQRLLFYRPPDLRLQVVWNLLRAEQTSEIFATGPEATRYRLQADGSIVQDILPAQAGKYSLAVPGATNRNNPGSGSSVMAGRPILLVERDTAAPFRALVQTLPEGSPPQFELVVDAADGGTGVGSFELFFAAGAAPALPADWQRLGGTRPWTADPLSGQVRVAFSGQPGQSYHFAARAADRAGNWNPLPGAVQASTRIEGVLPTPTSVSATPSASATMPPATASPTLLTPPSSTPPPFTPVPTAAASETSTDPGTPVTARAWLPLIRQGLALKDCIDWSIVLRGPDGAPLAGASGDFWELSVARPGQSTSIQEAPIDRTICVKGQPDAGWRVRARVAGYLEWPAQRFDLLPTLHLARAPNRLANGHFESAAGSLDGWRRSGSTPPLAAAASEVPSGSGAALLGKDFRGQPELGGGGNSTLSQVIDLAAGRPHLSGIYRIDARPSCQSGDCRLRDRLEIILVEDDRAERPAHYLSGAGGILDSGGAWRQLSFDLSAWSGRRVELIFNLYQPDEIDPSRVWLDNLAVGQP